MAKQTINPGTAPTGAGGDTFRSGSAKLQANDDELYNYLGDGTNLNKLGTAAFKNVGLSAGNVMEVGAFGLGGWSDMRAIGPISPAYVGYKGIFSGFIVGSQVGLNFNSGSLLAIGQAPGVDGYTGINNIVISSGDFFVQSMSSNGLDWLSYEVKSTKNTTVDSNGFIKAASPIVQLFANKIELNDEAKLQEITFEKLGVGDYLVKGSSGFAQEGWYVETPKDANGNLLVAVVYEQLANGDISVKTYDYMLNKKGRIVADTETPLDIPENRWIDLRLQELPQPKIEVTDDPEQ